MSTFNPYREWLGLEDHLEHPNHYELLGLRLDETNPQIISFSADKAIAQVRSQRPGLHVAEWSRLLDEIQTAKNCLLDEQKRHEYDRNLGNVTPVPTNRGSTPVNSTGKSASYNAPPPKMSGTEATASANFYPPGFVPEQPIAAELASPAPTANYNSANITSIATAPMHGLYPPGNPLAEQPQRATAPVSNQPTSAQPSGYGIGHPAMNPMAPNAGNLPTNNPMVPGGGYNSIPPHAMPNMPPMSMPGMAHGMSSGPMAPSSYMQPQYNAPANPYSPYAQQQPMGYGGPMSPMAPSPMSPAPMMGGPPNMMHVPMAPPPAMSPYGAPPTAQPWNNPAAPVAPAYAAPIPHAAPVTNPSPFAPAYSSQPAMAAPVPTATNNVVAANTPIQGPSSYRPIRRQSSSIVPLLATMITGMIMAGGIVGALIYLNRPPRSIAVQPPTPPSNTVVFPIPPVPVVKPEPKKEVPKPPAKKTEVVIKRPDAETKPPVTPVPETSPQPMPEKMPMPETKPQPTPMPSPTPVPTPVPTPDPSMSATPSAADLASLNVEMKNAREAFHEYNFEDGSKSLEKARQIAKLPEHKAKVERFARVAELAHRFRKAIVQTMGTLDAGDVIKIGSVAEVAVVEVAPDKLIVREQGMNNTYTLDSMKMGIALKLGEMSLNPSDPETRLAKGAYEFFDKKRDSSPTTKQDKIKKVETMWKEAELMGADIGELIKVLTDTYEFTADKAA